MIQPLLSYMAPWTVQLQQLKTGTSIQETGGNIVKTLEISGACISLMCREMHYKMHYKKKTFLCTCEYNATSDWSTQNVTVYSAIYSQTPNIMSKVRLIVQPSLCQTGVGNPEDRFTHDEAQM